MAYKIKKNDKVRVISGKDKGKEEKVIAFFPALQKVLVENVNKIKRHTKPTQEHKGGIIEKSAPINVARVMVVCPSCNKATRLGFKKTKDGSVRFCKKCQAEIK